MGGFESFSVQIGSLSRLSARHTPLHQVGHGQDLLRVGAVVLRLNHAIRLYHPASGVASGTGQWLCGRGARHRDEVPRVEVHGIV